MSIIIGIKNSYTSIQNINYKNPARRGMMGEAKSGRNPSWGYI